MKINRKNVIWIANLIIMHLPLWLYLGTSYETPPQKVAIIIDDLGNHMRGTKEIMEMPFPLTVAVMPFKETSVSDAKWAHQEGKDVIVHLPMEPHKGKRSGLGPHPITQDLSSDEIRRRVHRAIDNIPYAIGMISDTGSKVMESERIMRIVLEVCKERGLFFIDSNTSSKSVVRDLSQELDMPYIRNELFFNDSNSRGHNSKHLSELENYLSKHDYCIATGHVGLTGKQMAFVLKNTVPEMQKQVEFVGISDFVKTYYEQVPLW